ncbi:MAG: helix-turn-helix transcriptional regulator [Bacteroidales bacterium]|nr:helix-turn-helix transcriptional regulator [Bacteroidales bacterium]
MDKFSGNMKVAELVEANYRLLGVLSRVGIDGCFGEKTVSEVCIQSGLDPDTVILLCEVYSFPDFKPSMDVLRRCHVGDVLRYLHQSHDYYLNRAIVEMEESIEWLLSPCSARQQKVVWDFFRGYKTELKNHFGFEEQEVIPYVQGLIIGQSRSGFSIDRFEENHSNIDEKLSDFKKLVMKSLPPECDRQARIALLFNIFALQEDLKCHTYIEDSVLVPMVRLLESPRRFHEDDRSSGEAEPERLELSDREKEILVSVAQGLLNKEIADKHHISINTVITHRKNITRKTGIKTVPGLTVYAILNNLIDINSIE